MIITQIYQNTCVHRDRKVISDFKELEIGYIRKYFMPL